MSDLPLDWMDDVEGLARPAELLDRGPGAPLILAASLGLASRHGRTLISSWLEGVGARAAARCDENASRLAGELRDLLEPDRGAVASAEGDCAATGCTDGAGHPAAELGMVALAADAAGSYLARGHVTESLPQIEGAIARAQLARSAGIEALLRILAAHAHLARGDSELVERELGRATDAGPADAPPVEAVLGAAVRGTWQAGCGDLEAAAKTFSDGSLALDKNAWDGALIAAFEADALAKTRPSHYASLAAAAGDTLDEAGLSWASEVARRARKRSLAEAGQIDQALARVSDDDPVTTEQARTATVSARVLSESGGAHEAQTLLRKAIDLLGRAGATVSLVEALLALSRIADTEESSDVAARADALSSEDPLFAQAWRAVPALEVSVVGGKSMNWGTTPIQLGEKPEQLFLSVLLAGPAGAHWETVAMWLWPDEVDMGRLKSRVSSTTSLARKGLGTQAWRLVREGPILVVRRRRLELDLDVEQAETARSGRAPASGGGPLLPAWADLEWVQGAELSRRSSWR